MSVCGGFARVRDRVARRVFAGARPAAAITFVGRLVMPPFRSGFPSPAPPARSPPTTDPDRAAPGSGRAGPGSWCSISTENDTCNRPARCDSVAERIRAVPRSTCRASFRVDSNVRMVPIRGSVTCRRSAAGRPNAPVVNRQPSGWNHVRQVVDNPASRAEFSRSDPACGQLRRRIQAASVRRSRARESRRRVGTGCRLSRPSPGGSSGIRGVG
jgi:hypothetical protein